MPLLSADALRISAAVRNLSAASTFLENCGKVVDQSADQVFYVKILVQIGEADAVIRKGLSLLNIFLFPARFF